MATVKIVTENWIPKRGKLREFPAPRYSAGDAKEQNRNSHQHDNLRPEMRDWLIPPEDLGESVNGPGVDRQQTCFLHRFRHEEAREHASADGGHDQNNESGERP